MTHKGWGYLFALIVLCILGDALIAQSNNFIFVMQKGNELVEWLAFWR